MKLLGLALILLSLIGALSLAGSVKADEGSPPLPDWDKYVMYNVTDTGTYIEVVWSTKMVCDHGETYINSKPTWSVPIFTNSSQQIMKRVFFKIGIITGLCGIPEDMPPQFIVYRMEELPSNADIVSAIKLFGSRLIQLTLLGSTIVERPMNNYDANFDLDKNNIINMRDIFTAIKNFSHLSAS